MERFEFINLEKKLKLYGELFVKKYQSLITEGKHVASGRLRDSTDYEVDVDNGKYSLKVIVGKYMDVIDEGISNGKFPSRNSENPLMEWIRVKGIKPYNRPRKSVTRETEIRNLAYVIGRSIKSKGTIKQYGYRGSDISKRVLESVRTNMDEDFANALDKDLEILAEKLINNKK